MAILQCNIYSNELGMQTHINVLLPYDRIEPTSEPCKVLYLLHGLSDDCSAWLNYTGLARYARSKNLAVIMPEVHRSFYTDMTLGVNYFSYVTKELPALCQRMFHISADAKDTFIAGLSMGGYGALKCALNYPERYKGCASFSGVTSIHSVLANLEERHFTNEAKAILGPDLIVQDNQDIFKLAVKQACLNEDQKPAFFVTCGTEDFLHQDNLKFKELMENLPYDFEYQEWPGEHNWDFWDKSIQLAFDKFFGN